MKKKLFVILLAFFALILPIAVYATSALSRRQIDPDFEAEKPFWTKLEGKIATGDENLLGRVPVYFEDELLFKTDGQFFLGIDSSVYSGLSLCFNYLGGILEAYPTDAIRCSKEDSVYFLYDTDSGYRLCLYSQGKEYMRTVCGFPMVIGDPHVYDDFRSLKIGDSIAAVERIDSVAGLVKKELVDVCNLDPKGAASMAKTGNICTSVHYLRDGILRIEYEMLEDRSLVISNMEYREDYRLEQKTGNVIDYRINDKDLPENWTT